MSDREPRVQYSGTFTAGSQQFAARDINVHGPVHGEIGTLSQQLVNLDEVREVVATLRLTADERASTDAAIGELQSELSNPKPDASHAASALERLTSILQAAGGLAVAGAALTTPLGQIAGAIGAAAAGVLKVLGKG
jgi:hypothetical protein